MYLLDTVVVSELNKRRRNVGVMEWFEGQRPADLFISVISVGEIERGIACQRSSNPKFAAALAEWLDRVLIFTRNKSCLSTSRPLGVGDC